MTLKQYTSHHDRHGDLYIDPICINNPSTFDHSPFFRSEKRYPNRLIRPVTFEKYDKELFFAVGEVSYILPCGPMAFTCKCGRIKQSLMIA